jgi:hypothetical protein
MFILHVCLLCVSFTCLLFLFFDVYHRSSMSDIGVRSIRSFHVRSSENVRLNDVWFTKDHRSSSSTAQCEFICFVDVHSARWHRVWTDPMIGSLVMMTLHSSESASEARKWADCIALRPHGLQGNIAAIQRARGSKLERGISKIKKFWC